MSGMKVENLASTIGVTPEKLIEQLNEAGVKVSSIDAVISDEQKQTLLTFLRERHGKSGQSTMGARKVTLKRKSEGELNVSGAARSGKSINVVRKKRAFVKKTPAEIAAEKQKNIAAEASVDLVKMRQEKEMVARQQARVDAEKREEEAVEKQTAAIEAAKEAEEAAAAAQAEVDKLAAAEEKEQAEEKAQAEAKTEVEDKPTDKVTEESVTPSAKAPELTPAEQAKQTLAAADEKRRSANLARQNAEKALIERRKQRKEEEALEKERAKEQKAAEDKAKTDKATREAEKATKKTDSPTTPPADKDQGRRGRNKKSKYDREELRVGKGRGGNRKQRAVAARIMKSEEDNEHGFSMPTEAVVHTVDVPNTISVADLAQGMSVKAGEVIKVLMGLGTMATINQVLDQDTATIVIEEMGHIANPVHENALEMELENLMEGESGETVKRAPVVTVMGHVDHGKTSLLDYIRRSKVTDGEAGGITQHIGAYKVKTKNDEITFLDTPGHAAFTDMRIRGANATDIVVIVVAADDGVMPQTIEAVKHAKAAEATIIVAVNKIDKEDANSDRVKQELSNHEVVPEDWGGDVPFLPVSALTGQGIDDLLDTIALQAEVLELTAPVDGPATGVVIEARLDKGRGTVVTVLVQTGTLNKGDVVVVGQEYGRVRALTNEKSEAMKSATPSTPVELLGLSGTPAAGDPLHVAPDERKAREVAKAREVQAREMKLGQQQAAKLEEMFNKMEEGAADVQTLNVVVKADVHGSAEAVSQSLTNLSTDKIKVRVVSNGVGGINETDAQLAASSDAILIGFNVRADNAARKVIMERGLDVQYFSIIYDLIDVVTASMTGMLAPVYKDEIIGLAEVKEVFSSPKFGDIAGSIVVDGKIKRNNPIRVLRDNVVIYEGELESLRRFKDEVKEVISGVECGIGVKDYKDVQPGDQIEVFEPVLMKPTL